MRICRLAGLEGRQAMVRVSGPGRSWGKIILLLTLLVLSACGREKAVPIRVGDQAPGFSARDLDGRSISLADLAGHPVVLRFFLTDCKFCRADTPVLNEYYTRFKEKGLRVIYVDTTGLDRHALETFVKELGISFPVVMDAGGRIGASYNVRLLPQTVIIDPDQKIIAAILGGVSEPELNRLLSPYLR